MTADNQRTTDVNKGFNRRLIINLTGLAILNLLISFWMGQQAYTWMPPQASAESVLVDKLFSFMTTVGTFIFLGVVGTVVYSVLFQRAAKYDDTDGPPIEGNIKLEIIWTALPILLVIWIGTVSYQTYDQMSILGKISPKAMEVLPGASANVVATAEAIQGKAIQGESIEVRSRQWSWEFRYPESGISSTELHLPVNQRAHFKLVSEDVLHGFYVPAFRVKQDIVPGKSIDFALTPIREGRYRLRDSEYSGTYFAANQTNVVVESAEAYQQWLTAVAAIAPTAAENVAQTEFAQFQASSARRGWPTVTPAPAPIVNYTSSEKDSHE